MTCVWRSQVNNMAKHYTVKEMTALTLVHILFMLLFMPFSIINFIGNSNFYYFLYFYIPILDFILPIVTITLQERFHHKFGLLILLVFVFDLLIISSLVINLAFTIKSRIDLSLNIFGNIIPYYLLILSIILLITHMEIFKRSFNKNNKIRVVFLNSPI